MPAEKHWIRVKRHRINKKQLWPVLIPGALTSAGSSKRQYMRGLL